MSMTKEILQEKIKGQYDVVKLQGWLTALPNKLVSNTAKMSFVNKMKLKLDTAEVEAVVLAALTHGLAEGSGTDFDCIRWPRD